MQTDYIVSFSYTKTFLVIGTQVVPNGLGNYGQILPAAYVVVVEVIVNIVSDWSSTKY